jgi:hypothetical protein
MSRLLCLCLPLSVLAACKTSPPPPARLPIHTLFPVTYEGDVAPLAADADAPVPEPSPATHAPQPSLSFRTTLLELPLADARELAPELVTPAPTGKPSARGVTDRRIRALGLAGGHVDPALLRQSIDELQRRGHAYAGPLVATGLGGTATVSVSKRTAFVRSLHIAPVDDSFLVDDVDVATFEHGSWLTFAAQRDGDALRIGVEWQVRDPLVPIPVARTQLASLQVPVLARHRLGASAIVAAQDGLVLGSLPGRRPGTVMLLCVEVEAADAAQPGGDVGAVAAAPSGGPDRPR